MKGGFLATLAVAVALSAAFIPSPAQAQVPLTHWQDRAGAWKQIAPLLRERAKPKAGGFDFEPTFEVKTASGYTVRVAALGNSVAVLVRHGKGNVTAYLARGVTTSRRLQASYGPLGKLDMRFNPSARAARRPGHHNCHGHLKYPKRDGTWVGSFDFGGENHYLAIKIHRASGSIRRQRRACFSPHRHRPVAGASSDPFSFFSLGKIVAAGWHHELESASVAGLDTRYGTLYLAFSQSTLGSVGILRLAVTHAKPGTLDVNTALTHAEISPPSPFHGTGTYTAAADGTTTWTGDLTVNFPGAPAFPLTGEEFKAEARLPY